MPIILGQGSSRCLSRNSGESLEAAIYGFYKCQGKHLVLVEILAVSVLRKSQRPLGKLDHVLQSRKVILPHTGPLPAPQPNHGSDRLKSWAVLKSTFPPSTSESSISIPANSIRPGMCAGSNSTRKSMSLSGPKSSRNYEPKTDILRIWCRRQKSSINFLGISGRCSPIGFSLASAIFGLLTLRHYVQEISLFSFEGNHESPGLPQSAGQPL